MASVKLKGSKVLITGAGSGIGRAAAIAFARRGGSMIATDLHAAPLEVLRREVESLGADCLVRIVDVRDEAAMRSLADFVHAQCRALDVLVNNAGIGYLGRFLDSDLAHWERVLDINVMGVVRGCHMFIPRMIAAGGPRRVLNVASAAGIFPAPQMAAYAASKHAVFGLSEVLKMELIDTQVGITTVCPGIINTPIVSVRANVAPSVTEKQIVKLQAYYKTHGCGPEVVAEAMLRAVERGQDVVTVGPFASLVHLLRRVSLGLARRVTVRDARRMGYL
ncbi:MAG: SDR family NAD(P)-dependent oxidoreductase [Deltaproteobacteria bacterium]|nr:SDR family NAD(P)-dependent oxidoreductase [Deltaproteobacteria bacterium]